MTVQNFLAASPDVQQEKQFQLPFNSTPARNRPPPSPLNNPHPSMTLRLPYRPFLLIVPPHPIQLPSARSKKSPPPHRASPTHPRTPPRAPLALFLPRLQTPPTRTPPGNPLDRVEPRPKSRRSPSLPHRTHPTTPLFEHSKTKVPRHPLRAFPPPSRSTPRSPTNFKKPPPPQHFLDRKWLISYIMLVCGE
jgi:hypothetical protein